MHLIEQQILNLSDDERYLLCYYATLDGRTAASALDNLCSKKRWNANKQFKVFHALTKLDAIVDTRWSTPRMMVKPSWYLYALKYLYKEHPEWEAEYRLVGVSSSAEMRWVSAAVCEAKPMMGIKLTRIAEYVYPAVFNEEWTDIAASVNQTEFVRYVEQAVEWALQSDYVGSVVALQAAIDGHKQSLEAEEYERLCELTSLYRYYATGELKPYGSKTHYGLLLLTLRELHQRHYAEGLFLLQQALKARNKGAKDKNVFDSILANYFMMAAYAHDDNVEHRRKVVDVAMRKGTIQWYGNDVAQAVGAFLLSQTHAVKAKDVERLYRQRWRPNERFYVAAANFLATMADKPVTSKMFASYVPSLSILRHEFQHQLNLDNEERERLNQLYGSPILVPDRIVPSWEIVLNELADAAQGKKKEEEGPKTARLVYVVNTRYVTVREQTVLKSGRWSAGRDVSASAYAEQRVLSMDDVDRQIWKANHGSNYFMEDRNVLPYLVGSDRVFYGHQAPYLPVTVSEEQPYIIVDKTKEGFVISSNFNPSDDDDDDDVYISKKDDTHYAIVTIDGEQREYYRRLLALKHLPAASEDVLKQLLPVIAKKVEIHSPILAGEQSLETVKGADVVVVQVLPIGDYQFSLNLLARPLPEGLQRCQPGEGMPLLIDEVEGKRYQVRRSLNAERENKEELLSVIEEIEAKCRHGFVGENTLSVSQLELLYLMEYIGEHTDRFAVEWPEGEKLRLLPQPRDWDISLRQHGGWFEVEGEITLDDATTMDMAQLLDVVGQSGGMRFVRLKDGEFIRFTDKLRRQLERLEALSTEKQDGRVIVPRFSAPLLAEAVGGDLQLKEEDKAIERLCHDIEASYSLMPRVPRTLQAELRDYQADGFRWMTRLDSWGAGACLADDMGLGKTVQTIALLLYKRKEGASLVVAPTSVVTNWRNELERFAPTLNVTLLNESTADDRRAIVLKAKAGDVVLTTYGILSAEQQPLGEKEWNVICLDEAHTIKNRETKMAQATYELQAKTRIALTGTPLQNHLGELWSLFNFINPGMLGSFETFRRKFILPIEGGQKERQQQLRRIILPFILRRTKAEVVEELPDKTETVRYVELSREEMSVYELLRQQIEEDLKNQTNVSVSILAEITKLRQAACAASLARPEVSLESSKIHELLELIDDISAAGNRILIFSQFTSFLKMVRDALDEREIGYLYLDGATPMRQRERLVRQFQEGEMPIFIVSLKAGGLGLNLTGANYVIHLDPWWNPAIEQQATDRAYRIGQKQNVTVYHLISEHTIEEKILRLHKTKRDMADSLLEGTDVSHRITLDELRELLA